MLRADIPSPKIVLLATALARGHRTIALFVEKRNARYQQFLLNDRRRISTKFSAFSNAVVRPRA
jgi:hypothetical protein